MRLADCPITKKWPAQFPDRIQLYSLPTPNGVKVSIALEEMGLACEPHVVGFETNDQVSPEFISLNPNNKIPAIIDPNGPGGAPLPLFESGAILIYLAEKARALLPEDPVGRGFFNKFAGKEFEDKRPRDRYVAEAKRLLGVLDRRLATHSWIMEMRIRLPILRSFRGSMCSAPSMKRATWWASASMPG